MKRIRCPKCDESILFDETQYEPGRVLVFECPECHKQFKIRIPQPKPAATTEDEDDTEQTPVLGKLVVLENAFHFKQEIPLYPGENVVGRLVKGSNANAPSNTGTFLQNEILGDRDRVIINDGDIITIGATTMILRTNDDED